MPLYLPALFWALIFLFCLNIKAKPQDANIFGDMTKGGLMIMGNMAEVVSNAALIHKNFDFEMPFAKANSESQIGAGGAMRNIQDDDEDSSEEIRRKRALDLDNNAPCHIGTAGGGGTGTDDIDVEEARRRMYNRMRKAAAKRAKQKQQTAKKAKKKNFSSNDGNEEMPQALSRRKRQTEVDDLNASMTNTGNDLTQKAQQFAEKVHNIFQGFMNSLNEMAQRIKQQFSGGQTPTTTTNNEAV